eukprot:scaffold14636_cov19-Tisochrysis_lutea.AAC.2
MDNASVLTLVFQIPSSNPIECHFCMPQLTVLSPSTLSLIGDLWSGYYLKAPQLKLHRLLAACQRLQSFLVAWQELAQQKLHCVTLLVDIRTALLHCCQTFVSLEAPGAHIQSCNGL